MSRDNSIDIDSEYSELIRELSELAHIHVSLTKRLKRVVRELNKPDEDLERLEILLNKMRILRSRLAQLISLIEKRSLYYQEKNKDLTEPFLIIRFFEMSGLIEEERIFKIIIRKKPSIENYVKRDLEEIDSLKKKINRITLL
ncbi:MAG: hypothetical protein ABWJ42_00755 [Sulfolobales archaeon]